jgi:pseudoazurin
MKSLAFYLALFGIAFVVSSANAMTIEMLNKDDAGNKMIFSEELAKVDVGETVTWLPTSKGHNVEMIAGPDGAELPKKSKNGKEVSITFEVPGIYYYWCTPHKGMGMIGLVVVGGDTSNKDDIAKAKALGKSKKKLKALLGNL